MGNDVTLKLIFDPEVDGVADSLRHSFREHSCRLAFTNTKFWKAQKPDTLVFKMGHGEKPHTQMWLDDYNARCVRGYRVEVHWEKTP